MTTTTTTTTTTISTRRPQTSQISTRRSVNYLFIWHDWQVKPGGIKHHNTTAYHHTTTTKTVQPLSCWPQQMANCKTPISQASDITLHTNVFSRCTLHRVECKHTQRQHTYTLLVTCVACIIKQICWSTHISSFIYRQTEKEKGKLLPHTITNVSAIGQFDYWSMMPVYYIY